MHGGTVKELFNVLTPRDAFARIEPYLTGPRATERLPVERALGRVLAEDLRSPGDLPSFRRSTMDGFAVRAADTFGASEGLPGYLTLVGDVLMGDAPTRALHQGECVRIATGGMLPPAADAVVMVEQTQEVGATVEVLRAVAPGEN